MQSKIEQQVMSGVAIIYSVRQLLSRTALECYALAASGLALWQLVWVHKVFENLAAVGKGGILPSAHYLIVAVSNTQAAVQLTLVVAAVACIAFIIDTTRAASAPRGLFLQA